MLGIFAFEVRNLRVSSLRRGGERGVVCGVGISSRRFLETLEIMPARPGGSFLQILHPVEL
tara:strand:+ start:717 stop:899 length:183 start_codon:yes stop_codon:yes gene_type:complete